MTASRAKTAVVTLFHSVGHRMIITGAEIIDMLLRLISVSFT